MNHIVCNDSMDIPLTRSDGIDFNAKIFQCSCLTSDTTEQFNNIIRFLHL